MAAITDLNLALEGALTDDLPAGHFVGTVEPTGGEEPFTYTLADSAEFSIDEDTGEVFTEKANLKAGDYQIAVQVEDDEGDTRQEGFLITVSSASTGKAPSTGTGTGTGEAQDPFAPVDEGNYQAGDPIDPTTPPSELRPSTYPKEEDAANVMDIEGRPADPDTPDGLPKYPNEPEPVIQPAIAENSIPTSPSFVYDAETLDEEGHLTEDRSLEKDATIRSPTWAEQAVHGAPGITISGKHQKDGKDYVQPGGNPGQIGHGMVLGKAGVNDWTAPKHPHDLPPQSEVPASTADASKLPDQDDPNRPSAPDATGEVNPNA
jgi:hypothetical protein